MRVRYTLQPMNGAEVVRKLLDAGWQLDRIHGSHHILVREGRAVPVPVHGKRDLGAGLIAALQRQTGVKLR